ncbi:hypothetical protein [Francisella philomiragia]|uniref:hypothetical protein n=1 Tax=Francisella philomiragia TaxID=28110 RepID=UPI000AD85C49|nr:hypothetical protein [Francisella philomiragia]
MTKKHKDKKIIEIPFVSPLYENPNIKGININLTKAYNDIILEMGDLDDNKIKQLKSITKTFTQQKDKDIKDMSLIGAGDYHKIEKIGFDKYKIREIFNRNINYDSLIN